MPLTDGFKRFFRRSQGDVERDVDDELQFHLDMKAGDLEAGDQVAGGSEVGGSASTALSPAGARAEALSRFGDLEEIRGQCLVIQSSVSRRRSRGGALDGFLQNLGVAVRTLRRRPGLTAAAVLTLALGIGATAAMFGVVSKVVLAPLPFQTPDRVVQLWDRQISLDNFRDYESRNDVFSHVAALRPVNFVRRTRGPCPVHAGPPSVRGSVRHDGVAARVRWRAETPREGDGPVPSPEAPGRWRDHS